VTGAFYLALGCANIWVAMNRSEAAWVQFKVWIAGPAAIVFSLAIMLWILWPLFAKEKDGSAP
jgi:intracellular septation protein A